MADALVLLGLIVWTRDVVVEFFDRLEILHLIEGNCKCGRCRELYLSEIDVAFTISVSQI